MQTMKQITDKAKKATSSLAVLTAEKKNSVLLKMAEALDENNEAIKSANAVDIKNAQAKEKNKAFLDRLEINDKRMFGMIQMMKDVAGLKDPVGDVIEKNKRPNGLIIEKVRVPIGVIGIIYESRPNVTADCVSLCFKSGNAVILRGGSDAINTNKAIYDVLKNSAILEGIDEGAFILIEDTSREMVDAMLVSTEGIDLIMPRGGESLIKEVVEKSRVPVIKHYKGVCHIYVDKDANLDMAEKICFNAKVQRPGVCNAMETMLVHKDVADKYILKFSKKLQTAGVKINGCVETLAILGSSAEEASNDDFATEWLDLILNVKVVSSLDEAIEHISTFGSAHSDAIVTDKVQTSDEFLKRVDSSSVYVNASTRFTDGGEFGKGAEIGISTDKLHARGPMGLEELTTYKYIIRGNGQIRE